MSSSAIARAVADAAAGDYASAIETLVTAIGLINQSRVASDERSVDADRLTTCKKECCAGAAC